MAIINFIQETGGKNRTKIFDLSENNEQRNTFHRLNKLNKNKCLIN